MLAAGEKLRDETVWKYPIMPQAIMVFQQLASMREWTISGPPSGVSRAVEYLNNTQTINPTTGMVQYGLEQFAKRRALDYLLVGRTAMASQRTRASAGPILEYIDPIYLRFNRSKAGTVLKRTQPVKPAEKIWWYWDRHLRADEVMVNHPFPIGAGDNFIAPVVPLLPSATLAYLLREHDLAAVDGRKIREILFVGNVALESAIEEAITIQASLWSGASVEEVGIPVVEVNNPTGQPIENYIARLGLSQIPDAFSREEFIFAYVNEIASALGLALRHFWNNERTTNRALEVVQEQRQQQKGPATFVRTEQRLLNQSGFLSDFGTSERDVRFAYVEETDASSMLVQAQVLEKYAIALEKIHAVFGATIAPEDYVAWMQSEGVLPYELELQEIEEGDEDKDPLGGDDSETVNPEQGMSAGDTTAESDPAPSSLDKKSAPNPYGLDYDEIVMKGDGTILDRRRKVYSSVQIIKNSMRTSYEAQVAEETGISDEDWQKLFDDAIESESRNNQIRVKQLYIYEQSKVDQWIGNQSRFAIEAVQVTLSHTLNNHMLNEGEQKIVDAIAEEINVNLWGDDDE